MILFVGGVVSESSESSESNESSESATWPFANDIMKIL